MRRIGKRLIVTCVSLSMILQSFAPATNALAATINAAAEASTYSTTDDVATETGGDTSGETGAAKDDTATTAPMRVKVQARIPRAPIRRRMVRRGPRRKLPPRTPLPLMRAKLKQGLRVRIRTTRWKSFVANCRRLPKRRTAR